jgi:hypothetical protein
VPAALVEALREAARAGNAVGLELASKSIWQIMRAGDAIKKALVVAGAHVVLVDALRAAVLHTGHWGALGHACVAFARIVHGNREGDREIRREVVEAGALETLVEATRAARSATRLGPVDAVVNALGQFAVGGDNGDGDDDTTAARAMVKAGAHVALVELTRGCRDQSSLLSACNALWELAFGCDEVKAALVNAGAHVALAAATRADEATSGWDEIQERREVGLDDYEDYGYRDAEPELDDDVLTAICGALEGLAAGRADIRAVLVRDGVHEDLLAAVLANRVDVSQKRLIRAALVQIAAGPETRRIDSASEPIERVVGRLFATRPLHWAAYAADRIAPVLAAGLPPLFAVDICVYAFGDEFAPRDGSVGISTAELCARKLAEPSAPPRADEVHVTNRRLELGDEVDVASLLELADEVDVASLRQLEVDVASLLKSGVSALDGLLANQGVRR